MVSSQSYYFCNAFWNLSCFVVCFMSRLSVLIKTHSYISLTTILLKNLANTYMLFMEDGSWVSLISKPPSRTNNSSFSKTSNLKSSPKPFPSSHTFGLREHFLDSPCLQTSVECSLRTAFKQLSLLRDSCKAVRALVICHTAMWLSY